MRFRRLGRPGPEISVIGVGRRWRGVGGQHKKDSVDAIKCAVAQGVNWVDTAPTYGLGFSEELVGRAIAQLPASERPMVFTKCSRVWDVGGAVRSELARLAADAGYADQSHLTRESARLADVSPKTLLRNSERYCGPTHDHGACYGPLLPARRLARG